MERNKKINAIGTSLTGVGIVLICLTLWAHHPGVMQVVFTILGTLFILGGVFLISYAVGKRKETEKK